MADGVGGRAAAIGGAAAGGQLDLSVGAQLRSSPGGPVRLSAGAESGLSPGEQPGLSAALKPGPPLWLLLELTYRCPLHCVFC
jgi:hypothetical protein